MVVVVGVVLENVGDVALDKRFVVENLLEFVDM